jgi:hypothetical protein
MKYETKAVIIGRMKRKNKDEEYPCFVHLFDMNNPHKSGKVPQKMLDFDQIHKVIIEGLKINYLLEGNDLIVNNLEEIEINQEGPHLTITGKQSN